MSATTQESTASLHPLLAALVARLEESGVGNPLAAAAAHARYWRKHRRADGGERLDESDVKLIEDAVISLNGSVHDGVRVDDETARRVVDAAEHKATVAEGLRSALASRQGEQRAEEAARKFLQTEASGEDLDRLLDDTAKANRQVARALKRKKKPEEKPTNAKPPDAPVYLTDERTAALGQMVDGQVIVEGFDEHAHPRARDGKFAPLTVGDVKLSTEGDTGYAEVSRKANGRRIGHIVKEEYGSRRAGKQWVAYSGITGRRQRVGSEVGGTHEARRSALQKLLDHVNAHEEKLAKFRLGEASLATRGSRGRAQVPSPTPAQAGTQPGAGGTAFEGQHPRGRGGKWIAKGQGVNQQGGDQRVKEMQQRLAELGFHTTQDGQFGIVTEEAVKAFQRKYGLPESGKVDEATVETMRNPPKVDAQTARRQVAAEVGQQTKAQQQQARQALNDLGYEYDTPEEEARSLRILQRQYGLNASGKLDRHTLDLISRLQSRDKRQKAKGAKGSGLSADQLQAAATTEEPEEGDMSKEIDEASYSSGGFDTNTPVRQSSGGVLPGLTGGVATVGGLPAFQGASLVAEKQPGRDAVFGNTPVVAPPNLRESADGAFARCGSCLHHNGKKLCALYSAGTDRDDLCDSWATLSPPEQIRAAMFYSFHVGEFVQEANSETAAKLRESRTLLEAAVEETGGKEHQELAAKFTKKGMPPEAAKKAATKALAAKRAEEAVLASGSLDALLLVLTPTLSEEEWAALDEAADSMAKATQHEEVGHTGKGLWGHKGLQLPAYIQHIANDIREKRGKTTSQAIAIAIGAVKRWARGGGKVDAGTKAAAAKALAEWEKLKATHGGKKLREALLDESAPPVEGWSGLEGVPSFIERVAKYAYYETGRPLSEAFRFAAVVAGRLGALGDREAAQAASQWDSFGREIEEADVEPEVVSVEQAQEVWGRVGLYESSYPVSLHFDPRLHPRGRTGQFTDVLAKLKGASHGAEVTLPHGVSVRRSRGGTGLTVSHGGKKLGTFTNTEKAAARAIAATGIPEHPHEHHMMTRGEHHAVAFSPDDSKLKNEQIVSRALGGPATVRGKSMSAVPHASIPNTTVIHSYKEPLAVVDHGERTVHLNVHQYSATTSGHRSLVRREAAARGYSVNEVDRGEARTRAGMDANEPFTKLPAGVKAAQRVAQDRHRRLHNEEVEADEKRLRDVMARRSAARAAVTGDGGAAEVLERKTDSAGRPSVRMGKRLANGKYLEAEAKLHKLGGNEHAHFSVTGTLWRTEGHAKGKRSEHAIETSGALADMIAKQMPELRSVAAMHLSDETGAPMHDVANGWYWYGLGERETAAKHLRVPLESLPEGMDEAAFKAFVEQQRPRWRAEAAAARDVLAGGGSGVKADPGSDMSEWAKNNLASQVATESRKAGSPINAYHARAEVDAWIAQGRDPRDLLTHYSNMAGDAFSARHRAAVDRGDLPNSRAARRLAQRNEQTPAQSTAMRDTIRRLGTPAREETLGDGTRRLEFRIGTRTMVRHVAPDGSVTDPRAASGVKADPASRNELKVARDTLKMNPAMAGVMGGPSPAQAFEKVTRLSGKAPTAADLHPDNHHLLGVKGGGETRYGTGTTARFSRPGSHNYPNLPNGAELVGQIKPGTRVTIMTPQGQERSGKAVMKSSDGGWVLNAGGAHGTPILVNERNIVRLGNKRKLREVAADVTVALPWLGSDTSMIPLLKAEEAWAARLPLAEVLLKHGAKIPTELREELHDMLVEVAPPEEMAGKLAEARERQEAHAVRLYETLVEAVGEG